MWCHATDNSHTPETHYSRFSRTLRNSDGIQKLRINDRNMWYCCFECVKKQEVIEYKKIQVWKRVFLFLHNQESSRTKKVSHCSILASFFSFSFFFSFLFEKFFFRSSDRLPWFFCIFVLKKTNHSKKTSSNQPRLISAISATMSRNLKKSYLINTPTYDWRRQPSQMAHLTTSKELPQALKHTTLIRGKKPQIITNPL